MTWNQLIDAITERCDLPRKDVAAILNAMIDVCTEALLRGDTVTLRGLGSFKRAWREARTVRSVADRRRMMLDGRFVVNFSGSESLRRALLNVTPQRWRDPARQAAWRMAEALVGDLELYHADRAPKLKQDAPLPEVAKQCQQSFGMLWTRALASFDASVPATIRDDDNPLLIAARRRWAQEVAST